VKRIAAILILAALHGCSPCPAMDFNKLADVIKVHENSIKFPYGCEHRVNGVLQGYPEPIARAKCIALCQKVFRNWNGQGDYFQVLNKSYAKDLTWWKDVENKYNKQTKGK